MPRSCQHGDNQSSLDSASYAGSAFASKVRRKGSCCILGWQGRHSVLEARPARVDRRNGRDSSRSARVGNRRTADGAASASAAHLRGAAPSLRRRDSRVTGPSAAVLRVGGQRLRSARTHERAARGTERSFSFDGVRAIAHAGRWRLDASVARPVETTKFPSSTAARDRHPQRSDSCHTT